MLSLLCKLLIEIILENLLLLLRYCHLVAQSVLRLSFTLIKAIATAAVIGQFVIGYVARFATRSWYANNYIGIAVFAPLVIATVLTLTNIWTGVDIVQSWIQIIDSLLLTETTGGVVFAFYFFFNFFIHK